MEQKIKIANGFGVSKDDTVISIHKCQNNIVFLFKNRVTDAMTITVFRCDSQKSYHIGGDEFEADYKE